jgi:hypothetical protein
LSLRTLMDQGTIILVNLAKGRLGEDVAALLGSLLRIFPPNPKG